MCICSAHRTDEQDFDKLNKAGIPAQNMYLCLGVVSQDKEKSWSEGSLVLESDHSGVIVGTKLVQCVHMDDTVWKSDGHSLRRFLPPRAYFTLPRLPPTPS